MGKTSAQVTPMASEEIFSAFLPLLFRMLFQLSLSVLWRRKHLERHGQPLLQETTSLLAGLQSGSSAPQGRTFLAMPQLPAPLSPLIFNKFAQD